MILKNAGKFWDCSNLLLRKNRMPVDTKCVAVQINKAVSEKKIIV